ncbi:Polyadenylate-binding protein-interacting protein 7 [Hibiscus syriacus]|uniref:Polyadenylate-binding protein-interacting protein 7 n=1 Tax=Hibiscus syriacus TaxID=106335 RepID=A0A6A2YTB4_HIBSY|nr:Polyadenylate-binding protein-interacting protein 7 [Hibiscus syriacus]
MEPFYLFRKGHRLHQEAPKQALQQQRFTSGTVGKAVLDRSGSSVSNNLMTRLINILLHLLEGILFANVLNLSPKPWDKQFVNNDQPIGNGREGLPYNGNSRHFPGFAAESLAEVYFANGCDLNLTIEMLTQLELQVDGGFNQNLNSKTLSAPICDNGLSCTNRVRWSGGPSKYAEDDFQHNASPYRSSDKDNLLMFKSSSSLPSRGAIDFASAVRKMASQDSVIWKYDRNGSDSTVGSSRSSNGSANSYSASGRGMYANRLQSRGSARTAPVWLETGDAVANLYSELREEARDHARLRNAYFEQARQAFLIGNKALAKELSVKGQIHNMNMKAAHGKAQESIYQQRFVISFMLQLVP